MWEDDFQDPPRTFVHRSDEQVRRRVAGVLELVGFWTEQSGYRPELHYQWVDAWCPGADRSGPPACQQSGSSVQGDTTGSDTVRRGDDQRRLMELAARVQRMPYRWPAAPDAATTREVGAGTCAGKHALLAENLLAVGIRSRPLLVVGPLVPGIWPDLRGRAGDLLEVHECLTVETDWAGPLLVDVTWHPAAIHAGLPGTLEWDGHSDMIPAIEPRISHAVRRPELRAQKEALRARLYSREDRQRRDAVLAVLADRAAQLPPAPEG